MSSDDALFEIMRTQMGLEPKDCDEAFLNVMRAKFGAKKPVESKEEKFSKYAERVDKSEPVRLTEKGDLDLADIFANIDEA